MNALQIIPPKPAVKVGKSVLLFRVVVTTLLLTLVRISMSRSEDGIAATPDVVTQPAAASAAAMTEGSGSGSGNSEEKGAAPAQPIVQSTKPANEPPPTSGASVAPNSDLAPKSEDVNARKTISGAVTARSAGPARPIHQSRGQVDYRRWKSADRAPVWAGPPPIIYGPGPNARAPYAAGVDGTKTQDRMSMASVRGAWERVVEAPGAVLNGGKHALYGVLDSIW